MSEIRAVVYGTAEYEATVELRRDVLRRPLGLDFTPEQLALEKEDVHLALFRDGQVTACLILSKQDVATVRMRQVAVRPELQRQGLGLALVEAAEMASKDHGFLRMILHARESAVPFYLRLGYGIEGDPFVEVGLPHRIVAKTFAK